MSCRDAVYSNDYYNFIIRNSAYLAGYEPGECHIDLDSLYTIEFAKREGLPPLSLGNYTYASIPKCYTLLGEEALEATGLRTDFIGAEEYTKLAKAYEEELLGMADIMGWDL